MMILAQAEAAASFAKETGIVDKLLGPSGGFVLALCGLGFLGWYHMKSVEKHQLKLEEKDLEIRRLTEARVDEARNEATQLIDRIERYSDQQDKRWSKLARVLGLTEPLGQSLMKFDMMLRAIGKKSGASISQQSTPPPQGTIGNDSEDADLSIF